MAGSRLVLACEKADRCDEEVLEQVWVDSGSPQRLLEGPDQLGAFRRRELLAQLQAATGEFPRRLDPAAAKSARVARVTLDEPAFRWLHNEDAMATEKLAEGIRAFDGDARKLAARVAELAAAA